MKLRRIALDGFRNYTDFTADFSPGVNVIWGENAQGKTNLLEAISFLSGARSHRARGDKELISFHRDRGTITAEVTSRGRDFLLEVQLFRGARRRLFVNHVKCKTAAELGGIVQTVLFCPEDLALIKAGAAERIVAITDRARGALKTLADNEGYATFVIPDDVGGRFSVLTAVGLLPIACAGCDIDALMAGAAAGMEKFSKLSPENECYRYAAGPVEEIGNIYPREYSRMFYEGQKENGQEDIVNLVRCAWLGSQKYGALVWSGDIFSTYEDFRKQICAGLHMGLCGIPWWTTDIGGFHGGVTEDPDFQELLVRWFQFGTFCPVMRIHGNRGPREEIINKAGEVREGTGADNEVWSFGEKNYEILTKFIGVREKMRDYTRSLMAEAHEKGTPVMRTMFYEFPEDAACWDISDAYMFGSDILVAPIVRAKATSRTVYLPAGASWTLANTGDVYEGGKAYEIEAPIETLPIFLRDGKQGYLVGEI